MAPTPFKRGRFGELPAKPRQPHAFYDTEVLELELDSEAFGLMRVHVRRHGSGPPLLLIHGLMTSSYSWRYVYEALGQHYTCYAPDLPGNGRSERPLEPEYSPRALARWLAQLQEALGIRGERVIGNSMGGYLAMTLALEDPASMSRLVNLHSPGIPELRLSLLKAAFQLPGTKRLLRHLIQRSPQKWAHRHVHYYDESLKSLEEAEEYGRPLGDSDGAQALIKYLSETMSVDAMRDFESQLQSRKRRQEPFPVPLLLLYARTDPMVPPRIGELLAERILGSQLVRLDAASHFAHVDNAEAFLTPTLAFLAEGAPDHE